MPLNRIASYVFLVSLFAVLALWGYWPAAWSAGWPIWTLLGLAAVSLVLWVVFSIEALALWLRKRSTQFGIGLALMAFACVAILGVVNWLVVRNNQKWDVTTNKVHSLSDQSRKIARELQQKMTIRVWTQNIQNMSANIDLRKFLENYEIASKGKIKVEVKSPIEHRLESIQDNIKRDNVMIVRSEGGRESRIENYNDNTAEEQVTNALIQAIKGGKKTVCFLSGHGESSLNDTQPMGLSTIRDSLAESSYVPKEFNLAETKAIPGDCEAIVVVGPKGDPTEQEEGIIKDYLAKGGKGLVLLGAGTTPRWRGFAQSYGVAVNEDYLIDLESDPVTMVATKNYANDVEITRGLGQFVVFRDTSSLKLPAQLKGEGGLEVKAFVSSRDKVLSLTGDIKKMKAIRPKPSDFKGALPLAALVTKPTSVAAAPSDPAVPAQAPRVSPKAPKPAPESVPPPATPPPAPATPSSESGWNRIEWPSFIATAHAQDDGHGHHEGDGHDHGLPPAEDPMAAPLPPAGAPGAAAKGPEVVEKKPDNKMSLIVVGNHLFPVNGFVMQYGNLDFFLNSVSYLLRDEDLIGIRPRDLKQASLELNNERMRQVVATIFILSGLFIVGGITAHRRKSV